MKKIIDPKINPDIENQTQIPSKEDVKFIDNIVVKARQIKRHIENSSQLLIFLLPKRDTVKPITAPTIAENKSNCKYGIASCDNLIPL